MKTCRLPALLVPFLLVTTLVGCSAADWSVTYQNSTGVPLDYCPVVTDPPPPHRECNRTLQPGLVAKIDPVDFNPAIYDPVSKLGTVVQMALGDDPPVVLVRRFQYKVQPGLQGNDPAMQPMHLEDLFLEPDPDGNKVVEIVAGPIAEGYKIKLQQKP